jgi:hypothetical protein
MRILHQFGLALTRLLSRSVLEGTTVVYAAKGQEVSCYECDYEIRLAAATNEPEVRAARQERLDGRKSLSQLPESRVQDELLIVVGPNMSAKSFVDTLESLIRHIRSHGMVTGYDTRGRLGRESVD